MWSTADVVGEDVLHIALGILAAHAYLAHVADIKDAASLAHGLVLVGDVGVLYGHVVACKGRHQGAQGHVFVIKTGSFHKLMGFMVSNGDYILMMNSWRRYSCSSCLIAATSS